MSSSPNLHSSSFIKNSPTKNLAFTTQERKQAEKDAQSLANRIKLLQAEDAKARKKIEDTKKRVGDLEAVRKRNLMKEETKQR